MHTTYYVETLDSVLLEWFTRLKDAKRFGEGMPTEVAGFRIIKLVGPYKYEGRHARILEFRDGKYQVKKG